MTTAAVLITLVLTGASCSNDTASTPSSPSTTAAADVSPFGNGRGDSLDASQAKRQRGFATTILETVAERGGNREIAIAALVAAKAEANWMTPANRGSTNDIYGWYFAYNVAAESGAAVIAATNTFMENAAKLPTDVDLSDFATVALTIQRADPRGYDELKRFDSDCAPDCGPGVAEKMYSKATKAAEAAYAELKPR